MNIINKIKKHLPLSILIAVFDILLLCQLLAIAWCIWLGASGSAGIATFFITLSVAAFTALSAVAILGYKKINKFNKQII